VASAAMSLVQLLARRQRSHRWNGKRSCLRSAPIRLLLSRDKRAGSAPGEREPDDFNGLPLEAALAAVPPDRREEGMWVFRKGAD
jgi:hypothetical protein